MNTFFDKISELRKSAARFYKVDFHAHSPVSQDWTNTPPSGTEPVPELNKLAPGQQVTNEAVNAYRKLCTDSGRDVVLVTDHNMSRFALAATSRNDETLAIIPGIELSVELNAPLIKEQRIHVLAAFPENTGAEAIGRIFPDGTAEKLHALGRKSIPTKASKS